ncbi:DNA repair protein complementing XP-G cells homolog [Elysia marginata]|uniref:DNA repair protein complementing XP-G cells homolog n=1 Tax=Elysia marginata TaxID=1093978 RepID=A0AAV4J2P2_9GAST|nr:DNA repair protein complementing XP-G cells homolog [Elysia marginata]
MRLWFAALTFHPCSFCKYKFGWAKEKSDQTLVPMFKEWSKTQSQGRISSYFGPEAFVQTSKIKSDRLRKALEMVKNPGSEQQSEGKRATSKTTSSKTGKERAGGKKKSKKIETEDPEEVCTNSEKREKDEISDEVLNRKVRSKKVSFAEKIEEDSSDLRAERSGGNVRACNQEETEDGDFMLKMSEKVKKAKEELNRMKQAKDFACVPIKEEKAAERKGQVKGKGGPKKKEGKRVGNTSIPVSLDLPKRSGRSQHKRSARGGRTAVSKPTGAVNLSESSSSSDDNSDDEKITGKASQRFRNVKMKKSEDKPTVTKASEKVLKKAAVSTVAKIKPKESNANTQQESKQETKKKDNALVSKPVGLHTNKPRLQSTQAGGAVNISPAKARKSPERSDLSGSGDVCTVGEHGLDCKVKVSGVDSIASTKILKESSTDEVLKRKPQSGVIGANATKGNEKEAGEESLGEKRTPGGVDDTAPVDMSKADVSVINRRNMPSTLAYLNQRSRQDRMLLHQISGKRLRNAVELRMEQEERRRQPPVESGKARKEEEDKNSEAQEDQDFPSSALSFEDALFGGDLDSAGSPRVKKRKVTSNRDRSKNICSEAESSTAKASLRQKSSCPSSVGEKIAKPKEQQSKVPHSSLNSGKAFSTDLTKEKSCLEMGKKTMETKWGEKSSSVNKIVRKEKTTSDDIIKYAGSTEKTEENINSLSFFESSKESDMLAKQYDREGEKPKGKSKRSRAFDKPIQFGSSDDGDDWVSSPRKSFQNQLKHLHEPKSVKGHGPLYTSAPGPEIRARAFAGKGKGRGKNRTIAEGGGSGGGFVTAEEREQYENLTVDDLGSDFSDEGF